MVPLFLSLLRVSMCCHVPGGGRIQGAAEGSLRGWVSTRGLSQPLSGCSSPRAFLCCICVPSGFSLAGFRAIPASHLFSSVLFLSCPCPAWDGRKHHRGWQPFIFYFSGDVCSTCVCAPLGENCSSGWVILLISPPKSFLTGLFICF